MMASQVPVSDTGSRSASPTPSSGSAGPAAGQRPRQALANWLSSTGRGSNLAIKAVSLAVLLTVWQLFSMTQGDLLMPGPLEVAQKLGDVLRQEDFFFHMQKTLTRVLVGLGISLVVALAAGVPMGLFRPVERFLETYVLLGLTIPGLAWALIAVMIVGISDWAAILAIVVTTAPMIVLNMWHGTKSIDTGVLQMANAFGAGRWLAVRHVVLPQLLPFLLAGTRLGLALAWKIVVLSEMFGLSNGIGYQLNTNFTRYSLSGVLAWTLAFTIVMAGIEFLVLQPLERRMTRWRPSVQGV
ncbi:MAG: ABC transporter permease [Carbonactinosporaceae bacterium]